MRRAWGIEVRRCCPLPLSCSVVPCPFIGVTGSTTSVATRSGMTGSRAGPAMGEVTVEARPAVLLGRGVVAVVAGVGQGVDPLVSWAVGLGEAAGVGVPRRRRAPSTAGWSWWRPVRGRQRSRLVVRISASAWVPRRAGSSSRCRRSSRIHWPGAGRRCVRGTWRVGLGRSSVELLDESLDVGGPGARKWEAASRVRAVVGPRGAVLVLPVLEGAACQIDGAPGRGSRSSSSAGRRTYRRLRSASGDWTPSSFPISYEPGIASSTRCPQHGQG